MLGILVFGFASGMAGHALFDYIIQDRAKRIVTLFAELCLNKQPQSPEAYGLVPYTHEFGSKTWIDTTSRAFLKANKTQCTITTYNANDLTQHESDAISLALVNKIKQDFPALKEDEKTMRESQGFQFIWMSGEFSAPARWGIYLHRSGSAEQDRISILSFSGLEPHPLRPHAAK